MATVNGAVTLGEGALVKESVGAVNGKRTIRHGARVGGRVENVNAEFLVEGAAVGGGIGPVEGVEPRRYTIGATDAGWIPPAGPTSRPTAANIGCGGIMKTKQRDSSGTPGLPPAPAPPSRDANPWPMSAQRESASKLHPRVRGSAANAANRREQPGGGESPPAGGQKLSWLPYLMLVIVVATSLRVAIEAFEAGNIEAAVGPLVAMVFVAFIAWRRMRRRR